MIMDFENMFSQAQAVTATALSTDIVDLGAGDIGPSERISLYVNAEPAFTGSGSVVVQVLTSDALNTAGTALQDAITLATYPIANDALLAGGKLMSDRLPHGMKRYMRVNYAVTGTVAAGALTAGLVLDSQAAL